MLSYISLMSVRIGLYPFALFVLAFNVVGLVYTLNDTWIQDRNTYDKPVMLMFRYTDGIGEFKKQIGTTVVIMFTPDSRWKSYIKHNPEIKNSGWYYLQDDKLIVSEGGKNGSTFVFKLMSYTNKFVEQKYMAADNNYAKGDVINIL